MSDLTSTTVLSAGDPAPGLSLVSHDGSVRSVGDDGRPTIVYFYPAAFTPGCTTEACDFRDSLASLRGAGYAVLGVSPDPVERLAAFAEEERLSFPLLSDVDATAAKVWGAWGEKTVAGRTLTGVLRSTFVVGADGVVVRAEYRVDADGHVRALRRALGVDPS